MARVMLFGEALNQILDCIAQSKARHTLAGYLWGRVLDKAEIVQIVHATLDEKLTQLSPVNEVLLAGSSVSLVGRWQEGAIARSGVHQLLSDKIGFPQFLLLTGTGESKQKPDIQMLEFKTADSVPEPVDLSLVSLEKDAFERQRTLVNLTALSKSRVAVIGVGSGGARAALELAKSGVTNFVLVDPDILEAQNISRHPCGVSDIGRRKTKAVKDLILRHNPYAHIDTCEIDVLEDKEHLERIISECSLVLACTGSPAVNGVINEYCIRLNRPAVYAAAWEKAMAGYVMRVIPNETSCFACVHDILLQNAPPLDPKTVVDYSVVSDPRELRAEPGLSVDIGIITLIQAKLGLLVLLKNENTTLEDIPQNYILWFNKSYDRFKPFSCLRLTTKRRDDCPVCNYDGWLAAKAKDLGVDLTASSKPNHLHDS